MSDFNLIFGDPGLPRFLVSSAYVVAFVAGFVFITGGWLVGVLLLASAVGLIVVGTLKEYRDDQAKLEEDDDE